MKLTEGQQKAKDLIESGVNAMISGSAGMGKSTLLSTLDPKGNIYCAPTGIAALNIEGVTVSSLFSIPYGVITERDQFRASPKLDDLFFEGSVNRIIIDEISLVRADVLSLVDSRLRRATGQNIPFGGIQMVLMGDIFQLPPIVARGEERAFYSKYKSPWFFDSLSYRDGDFKPVVLTEVKRAEDKRQQALLESLRTQDKFWKVAVRRFNEISSATPVEGVWLTSYNRTAKELNDAEFAKLPQKVRVYKARNKGFKPGEAPVDEELALKVGTKILCTANHPDGFYVNGTQATVIGLDRDAVRAETSQGRRIKITRAKWDKYEYAQGGGELSRKKTASFTQFPIKLGYAISVHKSQGMTLDAANIDFGGRGAFDVGQAYVALSRCRDLANVHVKNKLQQRDIKVSVAAKNYYESLLEGA